MGIESSGSRADHTDPAGVGALEITQPSGKLGHTVYRGSPGRGSRAAEPATNREDSPLGRTTRDHGGH